MNKIVVTALYHFVKIEQPSELRAPLLEFLEDYDIRGTLILAEEGINGTVSGTRKSIDALYQWFLKHPHFSGVKSKESFHGEQPFYRTKVKIKKEIVTMGIEGIDPKQIVGTYVKPDQWNELVSDPEVLLIDTRNNYEFQIGSFEGAVNPDTDSFREFPAYVSKHLDPAKHRKVAMFCTGGIRCEKSTAFLKEKGFDEVFHLEGGILKYLEEVPEEKSIWKGDCFVFDNRVSVGHGLEVGEFELCHACRKPLSIAERQHEQFREGVSCHHCYNTISDEQRQRHIERQRQLVLSKSRGEYHLGKDSHLTHEARKQKKLTLRKRQRELSLKENGA